MAGLSLNMGAFGSGSAAVNGYPAAQTPAAAQQPTGPTSIGQKAFGIVTGSEGGPATAGYGLMAAGAISIGLLLFIYYSLPR